MTIPKSRRARLISAAVATAAAGAVLVPTYAVARNEASTTVAAVTATPARLDLKTGQCAGQDIAIALRNTTAEAIYADAFITVPAELRLPRSSISTYLPPNHLLSVPVRVTAPKDTPAGTYDIVVASGRNRVTVPVTVTPAPPDPSGNLARDAAVEASTTHSNFRVCGAVDGDRDSAHWSTSTGWNDSSKGVWPDWVQLHWDAPQTVRRLDLYTLDSTSNPASKVGLRDWDVQVFGADGWTTVAEVRGSTKGLTSITFPAVTVDTLRVLTLASNGGVNDYSRILELEVYPPEA